MSCFTLPSSPIFDVLPLIAGHFTRRYADQRWLIFDKKRRYGLYYDLRQTTIVEFDTARPTPRPGEVAATVLDEREPLFKILWQRISTRKHPGAPQPQAAPAPDAAPLLEIPERKAAPRAPL